MRPTTILQLFDEVSKFCGLPLFGILRYSKLKLRHYRSRPSGKGKAMIKDTARKTKFGSDLRIPVQLFGFSDTGAYFSKPWIVYRGSNGPTLFIPPLAKTANTYVLVHV